MTSPRPRFRASIVGLAIAATTLAACAGGGSTPAAPTAAPAESATPLPPSAEPSPSPESTWGTFESTRHGYRVAVPPGWDVREWEGTWVNFSDFGPGKEVPGEDVLRAMDLSSFLVDNSMVIPDGMTPEEWLAELDRIVQAELDPACPGTTSEGTLAGEPAKILVQPCGGSVIVGRSVTHAGRGYYFTTKVPEGDTAAEATIQQVIDSIEFTDN